MNNVLDLSLVNWSRAQFALTAMYHWLFVPLTLGLSIIIAIMETYYYRTKDHKWKQITQFWMKLFGINFAIGVATGLILEFEFGTNWSNYSWFVGDIFGAPLAIEGIFAFFMETTFIAVMYFGWNKVSKGFHLTSTWLVALGSNLSAVWILIANAWMQDPIGMTFNPDTARNEMTDFWAIVFSPTAINKIFHTSLSSYILAAIFVMGISAWFLLKNREHLLAKRSIKIASVFGLVVTLLTISTGDKSSRVVAKTQPMKFAAMEAHFKGNSSVGLRPFAILNDTKAAIQDSTINPIMWEIKIPYMLSFLTNYDFNSYIPGIDDLVYGNESKGILSVNEKINRGYEAQRLLRDYQIAKKNNLAKAAQIRKKFEDKEWLETHYSYFGYGSYYNTDKEQQSENGLAVIPPIPITFYAFHIMVLLGFWFLLLFIFAYWLAYKDKLEKNKLFLYASLWSIPLVYLASETGWIVNEVGRQPWIIQDLMTNGQAVTHIDTTSVMTTFILFAVVFTTLLIAEISILVKQIHIGSNLLPIKKKGN